MNETKNTEMFLNKFRNKKKNVIQESLFLATSFQENSISFPGVKKI